MNWESLIAERIAAHRDTYAPQRIEDAVKFERATKGALMHKRAADLARESKPILLPEPAEGTSGDLKQITGAIAEHLTGRSDPASIKGGV